MKEEILRAIEIAEKVVNSDYLTEYDVMKEGWLKSDDECDVSEIFNWYENLVLQALQEQLNRLEGCVDCNNIDKCDLCKRKNVVRNSYPCLGCKYNCVSKHRSDNTNFEQRVFYCQNCGRELKGLIGGEDEM